MNRWGRAIGAALLVWMTIVDAARAQDGGGAPADPLGAVRTVQLVYMGGSGGIGEARYSFRVHERLAATAATAGYTLSVDKVLHGVFHQAGSAVWGTHETVASTLAFLRGGPPSCEVVRRGIGLRTPTEWVLLPAEAEQALAKTPEVTVAPVVWHRCHAGQAEAWWVGPPGAPEPTWKVDAFDIRVALALTAHGSAGDLPVYILGMPRQEADRRARALLDLLSSHPDAVFVDSGDFLPGVSSVRIGAKSMHWAAGLDLLRRLHPAVLVPSRNELTPGPRDFLSEAAEQGLTYVATNWQAKDPDLALPKVIRRDLGPPDHPVDVAFLGVVDPAVAELDVSLGEQGVTLLDPVKSVQAEVNALALSQHPPDLVVLLALVGPALQAELRRKLTGVDLHLGDPYAATLRVKDVAIDTRPTTRLDKASPITLPMDGILFASLQVGAHGLQHVAVRTVPVTADDPRDDAIAARITAVRAQVYPGHDEVLIPAPKDQPLGTVSDATVAGLVCRAVLQATGADVVFLPPLAAGTSAPGPLTEIQVSDRLALLDVLEEHEVDGDRMEDFLLQAKGVLPTSCGADLGARSPKVRGRYVDVNRTYHVITTDRARLTTPLGAILDGASSGLALQTPAWHVLTRDGKPEYLSAVAMKQILAWHAAAGPGRDWVDARLARGPSAKDPLWQVSVDQLSLQVESFRRTNRPDAYSQVPETRINSPDSLTLGGHADVAVEESGPKVSWDARYTTDFSRLYVKGQTAQETADDWRLSSALSLPLAAIPVHAAPQFAPYAELAFDSEYTPLVDSTGATLPRQADLSLTVGLSAVRWKWLRVLKVGAFVNQDMARLKDKTPESGASFEAQTRHDLLRASAVRVETHWFAQIFGNTPQDDAADLRFEASGEVRLQLRLIRWLNAALYAQGLVLEGRVPETKQVAASATVGASLDMAASFLLSRYRSAH